MVVAYLEKFREATRADIDALLLHKLSDTPNEEQRKAFVKNLLQEMKRGRVIKTDGSTRWAKWRLSKTA